MNRVPLFPTPGNSNSRHVARAYSDNEEESKDKFHAHKLGNIFPTEFDNGARYMRLRSLDGAETDPDEDDKRSTLSIDEFGENQNYANRLLRTGRQRKKLAARSKGGEFRQRRKKRRLYFCCLSSEIDVQKLFDHLVGAESLSDGWKYQLHADVLHLYKAGIEMPQAQSSFISSSSLPLNGIQWDGTDTVLNSLHLDNHQDQNDNGRTIQNGSINDRSNQIGDIELIHNGHNGNGIVTGPISTLNGNRNHQESSSQSQSQSQNQWSDSSRISGIGAHEVFVFDFGSAVFWGFSRGEETNLLKTIRMFVTKGLVGSQEFQSGEDDMAFVCVPTTESDIITIANDVITLPDDTPTKERMSVSFAIAQSTVLAIFEARVELKVEDYR